MAKMYPLSLEEQDLVAKQAPEPMASLVPWKRSNVLELSLMSQHEDVEKGRSEPRKSPATAEGAHSDSEPKVCCPSGVSTGLQPLPLFPFPSGEAEAARTYHCSPRDTLPLPVCPALSFCPTWASLTLVVSGPGLTGPTMPQRWSGPAHPSSSAGAFNSQNILFFFFVSYPQIAW